VYDTQHGCTYYLTVSGAIDAKNKLRFAVRKFHSISLYFRTVIFNDRPYL